MNTKLVAIINLTPDSFSDGGRFSTADDIISNINQMAVNGASIVDIGAESTRPNAKIISTDEEWERLEDVLNALKTQAPENISISIDTKNSITAEKILRTFKNLKNEIWINDVSAAVDKNMPKIIADSNAKYVFMHNLGVPADKDITLPDDCKIERELLSWATQNMGKFIRSGIKKERLIFDPGLGFGKNSVQSIEILKIIPQLKNIGLPLLIGHSRKSFLSEFSNNSAKNRDCETAICSFHAAIKGADYLRVHDIKSSMAAIKMATAFNNV